ncbi:MAG: hypothetical protein HC897_14620 [Thermoanaerobaculia bacterium]|nr:hypothetical protein [Thermoanaerobaculia bacterium]
MIRHPAPGFPPRRLELPRPAKNLQRPTQTMSETNTPTAAKLGTFYGVFTPSILTILGVVLFLRTGWVVGQVGLAPALGIIVMAHLITMSTALSVAAIATNMNVGAGAPTT